MAVQAAQVKTVIDAPPDTVWQALTTASTLKQFFFGADVVADWRVGQPIRFRGEWKGKPYEDKGTVKEVTARTRLAFTHWSAMSGLPDEPDHYHLVAYDLKPVGAGTEVVLTQTNQDDNEPLTEKNRADYAKNWTMVLEGLKKTVEGLPASVR